MSKELFIQEPIERVLLGMNFIEKYEKIANKYSERDNDFNVDRKEILKIIEDAGYKFKYSKAKEFYFNEHSGPFDIHFGFTIRFNSFDFGISIKNSENHIFTAAPLNYLVELIKGSEEKAPRIMFKNYQDIKNIFSEIFNLYEEIKSNLNSEFIKKSSPPLL